MKAKVSASRRQAQIRSLQDRGGVKHHMLQLTTFLQALFSKVQREEGQTAIEYALVLLLIAVALVTALALGLDGVLSDVISGIQAAL
jgi:Flp pilus assembly pilin Flp